MSSHSLPSLREFVRPIPDAMLPRLHAQSARGIRSFAVLLALFGPGALISLPIELLFSSAPARSLVVASFIVGCAAVVFAIGRTAWAHRHLPVVYTLALLIPVISGALLAWANPALSAPILPLMIVIPLVTLYYYPLRPVLAALAQAPVVMAITGGYALLPGGHLEVPPPGIFSGALALGLVGAASSQVMRRRWLELERTKDQLVAAERMSTLGSMSARIAHELKTPIAAVQNAEASAREVLAELRASLGDARVTEADLHEIAAEIAEHIDRIGRSAGRAGRFIQSIRDHAVGALSTDARDFSVRDRVEAVLELLSFRLRRSPVTVNIDEVSPALRLTGIAEKFDQIATNLIGNALDACEESGIGSTVRVAAIREGDSVLFSVEDDGPGVADAVRDRLFSPMVTTRAAGSGLGLAISRDIASASFGGTLALRGASRFELRCPLEPIARRA
jgi:signal transduction histidine kinase